MSPFPSQYTLLDHHCISFLKFWSQTRLLICFPLALGYLDSRMSARKQNIALVSPDNPVPVLWGPMAMHEGKAKLFLLLFSLNKQLLVGFAVVVPFESKGLLQGVLTSLSLNPADIGNVGEGHLAVGGIPGCCSNKGSRSGGVNREGLTLSLFGSHRGMIYVPDCANTKILVIHNSLICPACAKV